MPDITVTFTDHEWNVLCTCLLDPVGWLTNVARDKLRQVTDRVYEETTGKLARKAELHEKVDELNTQYQLKRRGPDDDAELLAHEKIGVAK